MSDIWVPLTHGGFISDLTDSIERGVRIESGHDDFVITSTEYSLVPPTMVTVKTRVEDRTFTTHIYHPVWESPRQAIKILVDAINEMGQGDSAPPQRNG